MLLLDISLRFPAITLLLFMSALSLRQAGHLIQGKIAAIMCCSIAALLIYTMPDALNLPWPLELASWFLHGPALIFFWWFGLSLFQDDFELNFIHWFVLGADYVILFTIPVAEAQSYIWAYNGLIILSHIINLCLMTHLFYIALMGREDDLVESRRFSRLFFILTALLVTLILMNSETLQYLATGLEEDSEWLGFLRLGLLLPVTIAAAVTFLRVSINFDLISSTRNLPIAIGKIAPQDLGIYNKLMRIIETEKVYLQPGLSIGKLADQIKVPEHQLRALINQSLGYRNFSTFLNTYRLADAKAALADPELARTPILRIATDVGYASLATFNRVFKAAEDMTPREYRAAALEQQPPSPVADLG